MQMMTVLGTLAWALCKKQPVPRGYKTVGGKAFDQEGADHYELTAYMATLLGSPGRECFGMFDIEG